MRRFARLRLLCLTALLLPALSAHVVAQCPDLTADLFEAQGYTVRAVAVRGPLVDGSLRDVVARLMMPGAPFTASGLKSAQLALREALQERPALFESRIAA